MISECRFRQFRVQHSANLLRGEAAIAQVEFVDDVPLFDDADAVSQRQHVFDVVGNQQQRNAPAGPHLRQLTAQFAAQFPKLELFKLESVFGSWREAQKVHFIDGGVFDRIVVKR